MVMGQMALGAWDTEVVRLKSGVWHLLDHVDEFGNERARCGVNISRWNEVSRVACSVEESRTVLTCERCIALRAA